MAVFKRAFALFPNVKFYHPRPLANRWHVKANIEKVDANFWPHRGKFYIHPIMRASHFVNSVGELKKMIHKAVKYSEIDDEVIED